MIEVVADALLVSPLVVIAGQKGVVRQTISTGLQTENKLGCVAIFQGFFSRRQLLFVQFTVAIFIELFSKEIVSLGDLAITIQIIRSMR